MQSEMKKKGNAMIYGAIALAGIVLGRLAVRFIMNQLLGGTLFGGNFL